MDKSDIEKQYEFSTDKVSGRVRDISTAILAFTWLFIVQAHGGDPGKTTGAGLLMIAPNSMVGPIFFALLALLSDFGQYFFGYIVYGALLETMNVNKVNEGSLDTSSTTYRLQKCLFRLKIVSTSISAIWLLVVLFAHMI